jgi:hypothetical protein
MNTQERLSVPASKHLPSTWDFIAPVLSGLTGVTIGLVMGNLMGLI